MEFQKYCRERREFLKAERLKMEPPYLKEFSLGFANKVYHYQFNIWII